MFLYGEEKKLRVLPRYFYYRKSLGRLICKLDGRDNDAKLERSYKTCNKATRNTTTSEYLFVQLVFKVPLSSTLARDACQLRQLYRVRKGHIAHNNYYY